MGGNELSPCVRPCGRVCFPGYDTERKDRPGESSSMSQQDLQLVRVHHHSAGNYAAGFRANAVPEVRRGIRAGAEEVRARAVLAEF